MLNFSLRCQQGNLKHGDRISIFEYFFLLNTTVSGQIQNEMKWLKVFKVQNIL